MVYRSGLSGGESPAWKVGPEPILSDVPPSAQSQVPDAKNTIDLFCLITSAAVPSSDKRNTNLKSLFLQRRLQTQ